MQRLFYILLILSTLSACGTYNMWGVHNGWGTSRADHSERVVVNEPKPASTKENESKSEAKSAAPSEALQAFSEKEKATNLEQKTLAISDIPRNDFSDDTTGIEEGVAEDSTSIDEDEPQYSQEELDAAYFAEKDSRNARIYGIMGMILLFVPIVGLVGIALIISSLILANRSFNSKYNTMEGLRIARNWRIINWVVLGILMLPLVILGIALLVYLGII